VRVAEAAKLIASVIFLFFLTGCGPDDKKETQSGARETIKMWVTPTVNEEAFWSKIVAEWNKDPAHMPVEFTAIPAANSSEEAIMNALASGTEPDISTNIFIGFAGDAANLLI